MFFVLNSNSFGEVAAPFANQASKTQGGTESEESWRLVQSRYRALVFCGFLSTILNEVGLIIIFF
jgi:hypothetical protein